jgi:predicted transcriptional regulator of viral defense system
MRRSQSLLKLAPLLSRPFFTIANALKKGVTRQTLAYFTKTGALERIGPGRYRSTQYEPQVGFEWEQLALVAASIPEGVICLISALCYYGFTDQIMREAWIAIPHRLKVPKRIGIRAVRMRNIDLGNIMVEMGEFTVQMFDRERCIVDAFRYLDKEIAIKALKNYLHSPDYKPQLKKLYEYAKALRVDLTSYILALTT